MSRIYHQYNIEEIIKNPRIAALFYKWLRRELVYTSNAIELNQLTRAESDAVLSDGKKPKNKYKDTLETLNLANTLDVSLRAVRSGAPINEDFIKSIHFGIMQGVDDNEAGFYRRYNVRSLGYTSGYTNYLKIPDRMKSLIEFINKSYLPTFNTAIEAHYKLASLHPFGDGNGRTARLLMNVILMRDGIIPIFVPPERKKEYTDSLDEYRTEGKCGAYNNFMEESFYASAFTVFDFLAKNKIR